MAGIGKRGDKIGRRSVREMRHQRAATRVPAEINVKGARGGVGISTIAAIKKGVGVGGPQGRRGDVAACEACENREAIDGCLGAVPSGVVLAGAEQLLKYGYVCAGYGKVLLPAAIWYRSNASPMFAFRSPSLSPASTSLPADAAAVKGNRSFSIPCFWHTS